MTLSRAQLNWEREQSHWCYSSPFQQQTKNKGVKPLITYCYNLNKSLKLEKVSIPHYISPFQTAHQSHVRWTDKDKDIGAGLAYCWGSPEQKALAILWTLGLGGDQRERLGEEKYWVNLSKSATRFSSSFPYKEASAEPLEDLCPRPQNIGIRKEDPRVRNANMRRAWPPCGTLNSWFQLPPEAAMQWLCPKFGFRASSFPHKACHVKPL